MNGAIRDSELGLCTSDLHCLYIHRRECQASSGARPAPSLTSTAMALNPWSTPSASHRRTTASHWPRRTMSKTPPRSRTGAAMCVTRCVSGRRPQGMTTQGTALGYIPGSTRRTRNIYVNEARIDVAKNYLLTQVFTRRAQTHTPRTQTAHYDSLSWHQ